ncbi:MAG: hypothetical protein ACR2RV_11045 [Verrucomicrobiales bacterium]
MKLAGELWPPIRLETVDDPALGGIWNQSDHDGARPTTEGLPLSTGTCGASLADRRAWWRRLRC